MFMSKLTFDSAQMARSKTYEAHQAIWAVFSDGPDRKRDFLYRQVDAYSFLTVSDREPIKSNLLQTCFAKTYAPKLCAGERILFSLRLNPVVKRRNAQKRQVRVDMVQDRRKRLMDKGATKSELPSRIILAEEVAIEWLNRRHESLGLNVENVMVESYEQDKFHKKNRRTVTLSRIDISGFATVDDAEKLRASLYNGVGCAKGFGFGLLLIKRA